MNYSFVLMRVVGCSRDPGGCLTAIPIAHDGCEADEDGVETLIASGLVVNFTTCCAAFERENRVAKIPVLVQMCFKYDYAINSSALKNFIDCSC